MIKEISKEEFTLLSSRLWDDFNRDYEALCTEEMFYIIFDGDKKAGTMHIQIKSTVSYLKDLIIDKDSRGKGLGSIAMEKFIKISRDKKCHKMRIKTCPARNPEAYNLYKKYGFIEEAVLKNDYFNLDWAIMFRLIDDKR